MLITVQPRGIRGDAAHWTIALQNGASELGPSAGPSTVGGPHLFG